jgi:TRAP-type mannitol/chloroaromatic compound transport system permease large subunit
MKIRKELWFGFILMAVILAAVVVFTPWTNMTNGHLGLLMLALIVVAIMLGFPTAFTLMGMGVFFGWLAYRSANPDLAVRQILDLMVQRTYAVMANDVLIAVPLFVFMGYLVERAALIDRLFKSLHLATSRVPGSLAVATVITCAVFATATGIVGAVVTLMGLLAFPAMLKAGYNVKIASGAITAGGCLGILIPPSVLLIVYGATAGVSVVQLYAGALFPGIMLASLYLGYVIVLAKLKPDLMPPLPEAERRVPLPAYAQTLSSRGRNALTGLLGAVGSNRGVSKGIAGGQLFMALLPAIAIGLAVLLAYRTATAPALEAEVMQAGQFGLQEPESDSALLPEPQAVSEPESPSEGEAGAEEEQSTGLTEPSDAEPAGELAEPGEEEAPAEEAAPVAEAPAQESADEEEAGVAAAEASEPEGEAAAAVAALPAWFWYMVGACALVLALLYWAWTWERFQIFKLLLGSFFPLALLILAVLGSIMFGLATPAEAAAVGAFGGFLLTIAYRYVEHWRQAGPGRRVRAVGTTAVEVGKIVRESSFLTAKTSAMVCWLFVGSSIFSASFALLGGQELIERWVLSMDLSKIQFLVLTQFIIFILGWPLEWTEIIVIFMPIFVPLLAHFDVNPLFFGLLVALNLQTAFLSPPVAMAAFYLKGVAPPHVTLNQIFMGMLPFMGLQIVAMFILYVWPEIGLWLPSVLYAR